MKNRMLTLPFHSLDSEYSDKIIAFVDNGEIKKYSPAEESKDYDWKLFQLDNLISMGVQLKPVIIRDSVPLDAVNGIEMPLDYLKFVPSVEPDVNNENNVENVESKNE